MDGCRIADAEGRDAETHMSVVARACGCARGWVSACAGQVVGWLSGLPNCRQPCCCQRSQASAGRRAHIGPGLGVTATCLIAGPAMGEDGPGISACVAEMSACRGFRVYGGVVTRAETICTAVVVLPVPGGPWCRVAVWAPGKGRFLVFTT